MNLYSIEYFPILIFIVIATVLSSIIFGLSFVVASHKPDYEKLSAYECGFDPFDDARGKFDVRFYLVSILFIIFDLEVSFLFPFSVCFDIINIHSFYIVLLFLMLLTIGFIF